MRKLIVRKTKNYLMMRWSSCLLSLPLPSLSFVSPLLPPLPCPPPLSPPSITPVLPPPPPSFSLSLPQPSKIPVEEEDWFYGDIDRWLAESKCKQPGDYIVRYSTLMGKYALTCNNGGSAKHFIIQEISDVSSFMKIELWNKMNIPHSMLAVSLFHAGRWQYQVSV